MFRRLVTWIRGFFVRSVKVPPVKSPPQKAPVEIVKNQMTNPIIFHGTEYRPPLTVNALVHGGTLKQRDFMRNALNVMRHLVISDIFADRVLEYNFTETTDNALEIYKKFISGKDVYESQPDGEMDVDVTLYYRNNSTMGHTYPNTPKTWINMKHFNIKEYEIMAKVIGNIVHEYMHNLGYGHTRYWTRTRHKSVPYAYGNIARKLALEFLGSGRDIAKFQDWLEEQHKDVIHN